MAINAYPCPVCSRLSYDGDPCSIECYNLFRRDNPLVEQLDAMEKELVASECLLATALKDLNAASLKNKLLTRELAKMRLSDRFWQRLWKRLGLQC